MRIVVYKDINGKVMTTTIDSRLDEQIYIDRFKSRGFQDVFIVDSETLPKNSNPQCWYTEDNQIKVDTQKQLKLKLEELREERELHFRQTDREFIRALSQDNFVKLAEVKARQKYLRDITKTANLETTITQWNPN